MAGCKMELDPKVAADLEAYYGQAGTKVPDALGEIIEGSFLPKTVLKPGEVVILPAPTEASRHLP